MSWKITEDQWNDQYRWFLVDEGRIQYAFIDRESAVRYKEQGHLDYMLLTNLDTITHDTMLDPREYRAWRNKIQTCVISEQGF